MRMGVTEMNGRPVRRRDVRRKSVADEFVRCAPVMLGELGFSPESLFDFLAKRHGMTIPGVKYVLKEMGLYTTSKELKERYDSKGAGRVAHKEVHEEGGRGAAGREREHAGTPGEGRADRAGLLQEQQAALLPGE